MMSHAVGFSLRAGLAVDRVAAGGTLWVGWDAMTFDTPAIFFWGVDKVFGV